ncbi:MAG: MATE family efflux transporter [Planctomycetaceae bacterium]|nr:MATE family efflux transporter [Planctomycetaceae bacterium]
MPDSLDNPCRSPAEIAVGKAVAEPTGWWSRPCGGREVLAIALPLVVQTCFWSIMWFVDRLYLSWHSPEATAAALPGGMFHWLLICLPMGIASYINTFVAQYYGAGRPKRIGLAVNQGIWFGWATVPLFLLAIPLAPWLFSRFAYEPEVRPLVQIYFQVLALGAGAVVISSAQSSFYTGRGLTGIVMLVNLAGTLLDISLEYLFIFGAFGLPGLGIAGAAWTTVISNWATVLMFWLLMRRPAERAEYGLGDHRFDVEIFRRLLRYGVPSGLPQLVEAGAFTMLTNAVAAISLVAGAATSLAFTINTVAFVPMIGLNIAVSTLVGQKLGENRPDLAARAVWTAMLLGMAYTGLFAVLYLAIPGGFLAAHTAFADDPTFPEVRTTTIVLLRFVALYCFFDAMQIVFVGALRGAGDTRFILVNTSVISVLFLGLGYFLEHQLLWKETGYALWGWWWVLTGWIFALGVTYVVRFEQGRWKSMRVIEPDLADSEIAAGPELCGVQSPE